MIVLSIDIGIQVCAFCVCQVRNLDIELIKQDEIKSGKADSLPRKIGRIFEELEREVKTFNPGAIIVEKLYSHHRHPVTLGILAQIRGAIAVLSHQYKIDFVEYAPTRARKAFLGHGNVKSLQVKKMAENITAKSFKSVHTADAFSLVSAFSHEQKINSLIGLRGEEIDIARRERIKKLKASVSSS